jgi:hypothetical protein
MIGPVTGLAGVKGALAPQQEDWGSYVYRDSGFRRTSEGRQPDQRPNNKLRDTAANSPQISYFYFIFQG